MKKIVLASIALLAFCGHTFSQISKDSLVKLMAKDMCTEISKQDLSNKKIENFEMELGMAMLPLFTKYGKEIKEIYGFDIEDGGNAETVGKDIGMRLAVDCPAFLKLIMQSP